MELIQMKNFTCPYCFEEIIGDKLDIDQHLFDCEHETGLTDDDLEVG